MEHVIILLILSMILLYYAIRHNKGNVSIADYAFAGRKVGLIPLTATLVMTEFNTATLISFSTMGYIAGLKALSLPLVFLIGLMFYAFSVATKWKEFNGISVADFFSYKYGKNIGIIASVFLFLAMSGFSATYLKSLAFLFENYAPNLNHAIISAYVILIILFLIIRKGLVSIIKMDLISFFIVFALLTMVLFNVFDENLIRSQSEKYIFKPELLPTKFFISLIPLTLMSYILAPWYGQRIFAAKNQNVAFLSVLMASFLVFILYSMGVLICYFVALGGKEFLDPQSSFSYALDITLEKKFYYLGYIMLFLISSTTLTGMWSSMSNIILEYVPKTRQNNVMLIIFSALLTYILSNLLVDNILNKMILANIPVVALSFALLAGFYWSKVSIIGVYASIFVGLLSGISFYIYFGDEGIYTFYWAFVGIPLMFVAGVVFSLLFPDKL
jgi:Na+/proline symporter